MWSVLLLVKFSGICASLLNVPLVLLPEPVKAQVSSKSPKDIFSVLAQAEQVGHKFSYSVGSSSLLLKESKKKGGERREKCTRTSRKFGDNHHIDLRVWGCFMVFF